MFKQNILILGSTFVLTMGLISCTENNQTVPSTNSKAWGLSKPTVIKKNEQKQLLFDELRILPNKELYITDIIDFHEEATKVKIQTTSSCTINSEKLSLWTTYLKNEQKVEVLRLLPLHVIQKHARSPNSLVSCDFEFIAYKEKSTHRFYIQTVPIKFDLEKQQTHYYSKSQNHLTHHVRFHEEFFTKDYFRISQQMTDSIYIVCDNFHLKHKRNSKYIYLSNINWKENQGYFNLRKEPTKKNCVVIETQNNQALSFSKKFDINFEPTSVVINHAKNPGRVPYTIWITNPNPTDLQITFPKKANVLISKETYVSKFPATFFIKNKAIKKSFLIKANETIKVELKLDKTSFNAPIIEHIKIEGSLKLHVEGYLQKENI